MPTHVIVTDALGGVDPLQRVFLPCGGSGSTGWPLTKDLALWVYVGRVAVTMTPKYVEFAVTTVGAGAQTMEVGIFSTPAAPNKAGQNLTKIEATGTVDAVTSTGVKRNTTAFTTSVPSGTFLWAGIRSYMATTQFRTNASPWREELGDGTFLSLATAGALTAAGPWAGILPSGNIFIPILRVTLD